MKMSNLFPSPYFKASDLSSGAITLKIKSVDLETMGNGEKKPVLYFIGQDKALVLNKTNGHVIESLYGDDTNGWAGRSIQLTASTTEFGGKIVGCIRLRPSARDDLKEAEFV
jgi:hypothetical protein